MNLSILEDDILRTLKKFYGYKSLRPGQLPIITKILEKNDAMICKETGYGKSLCFQLAGLMQPGVTIIISPLLSSVEDECNKLATFTKIKCAYLHTDKCQDQIQDLRSVLIKKNRVLEDLRNVSNSQLKFLYVTVDYILNSTRLRHILIELYEKNLLSAVVVDEVHCVTLWIYLFKKDYSSFGSLRDLFSRVPFLFCSGPISKQSLGLIKTTLHLKEPCIFNDSSVRANLSYKVMYKGDHFPIENLIDYVTNAYRGKSGLMYCENEENCQAISKVLQANGIENLYYHSDVSENDKAYLRWMSRYGICIVCISGANVDINLEKIHYVVHVVIPNSLEVYFQEANRAGKNADYGECMMFYSMDDCDRNLITVTNDYTERMKHVNPETRQDLGCELRDYRRDIYDVVVYAENTSICRQIFLLRYFNEESVEVPCGICDVCTVMKDGFVIDMSHVFRKILMSIWSVNRHQKANAEWESFFTATIQNVIAALLGRVSKQHSESWLVKEWFFGSFASWDSQVLHRLLYVLLSHRYLSVNHVFNEKFEAFENLIITSEGQEFIKSNNELTLTFSRKDTSFTRWLSIDWIKDQFKKDLDGVVLYHSLHSALQGVSEWHGPYVAHLFHIVPGTWKDFKDIRLKFLQNEKSNFDEELFTVCLIYHQNYNMETMDQSNSGLLKSKILQTYVSKSLEGFKSNDDNYHKLLHTRFVTMKKLTTPALEIGLNIANSIEASSLSFNLTQLSSSEYEHIRSDTPISKQSRSEIKDPKNVQLRDYQSSIDPYEGDISEARSVSDKSETNIDISSQNHKKLSENHSSSCNFKKPKGIVAGVKRKLDDEKSESTIEFKKLKYESVLDAHFRPSSNIVFH